MKKLYAGICASFLFIQLSHAQTNTFPASGNIGIGTTSPGAKLDIQGGTLRIGDGAGSFTGFYFDTATGLTQENNNKVTLQGALQVNSTAGANSYIIGGNVGIGTVSPAYSLQIGANIWNNLGSNYALAVGGDFVIGNSVVGSQPYLRIYEGTGGGFTQIKKYAGYTTISDQQGIINFDGNVGIGTTSSLGVLDVRGQTVFANPDFTTTVGTGLLINRGASSGNTYTALNSYTNGVTSTGNLALQTVGGNVGIGTASPVAKLEVYSGLSASTLTGAIFGNGSNDASAGIRLNYRFSDGVSNLDGAYLDAVANADASGDKDFVVSTSAFNGTPTAKFIVRGNGNVGIGTTGPVAALQVSKTQANAPFQALILQNNDSGVRLASTIYQDFDNANTAAPRARILAGGEQDFNGYYGYLSFLTENSSGALAEGMRINSAGNVGIGTTAPNTKLAVNGTIHSKAVIVDLLNWPDYVFKPTYHLAPLSEVKTYIDLNHHLPDMPSEKEVADKGLDVGEMNKLLAKKVEELTLYLIEKDEELKKQKQASCIEEDRMNKMEQELIELKEAIKTHK